MVGWCHWLNGHEFEQTLGDSEGQGSLAGCSPWGRKKSDTTEWLNNNKVILFNFWRTIKLPSTVVPSFYFPTSNTQRFEVINIFMNTRLFLFLNSHPNGPEVFSYENMKVKIAQSYPTLCNPVDYSPPGSLSMEFSRQDTGVAIHSLLQGIFPTYRSNPGLPYCRQNSPRIFLTKETMPYQNTSGFLSH